MTKPLKPATTFEQQLDLLEDRGLVIADREKAMEVLSRFNYYTLSGYLFSFRKPGSDDYEMASPSSGSSTLSSLIGASETFLCTLLRQWSIL